MGDWEEPGQCPPPLPKPKARCGPRFQQYDVTAEQRRIIEHRAARRQQLREQFLCEVHDPFKQAGGGTVFDPAMLRHQARRETSFEHFRPTLKTARLGLGLLVLPYFTFLYLVQRDRRLTEERYRNGEVAYKDRRFKFH